MEIDDITSYHDVVTAEKSALQDRPSYGGQRVLSLFHVLAGEHAIRRALAILRRRGITRGKLSVQESAGKRYSRGAMKKQCLICEEWFDVIRVYGEAYICPRCSSEPRDSSRRSARTRARLKTAKKKSAKKKRR